jgi:phospholipid/cholesterol/gamma-HCH transport system permease protein
MGAAAIVRLAGDWSLAGPLPDIGALLKQIEDLGAIQQLRVDASTLGHWDSVLPAFLFELATALRGRGVELSADDAPEGLRRLLAIAQAVPSRAGAVPRPTDHRDTDLQIGTARR